jgi:hypothetical protein
MDITTIAAAMISTLVPYLVKGGEKLAEKITEEGFEQRDKIWNLTKRLFPEDELTLLNLFAENPTDAKTQGKIEGKLEDKLQANPEIAQELTSLLKQIPAEMKTNSINIQGNYNQVIQDIRDSTITIN